MYSLCVAVSCVLFISGVAGHPGGADEEACVKSIMNPVSGHSYSTANAKPPFATEISSDRYQANTKLTVVIKSTESFKGFLVMALPEDDAEAAPVGTFETTDEIQARCVGGATHTLMFNNANPLKDTITLTWSAPSTSVGNITFYTTVVKEKSVYWVKVASNVIYGAAAVPASSSPEPSSPEPSSPEPSSPEPSSPEPSSPEPSSPKTKDGGNAGNRVAGSLMMLFEVVCWLAYMTWH